MEPHLESEPQLTARRRATWNKGKLVGQIAPLKLQGPKMSRSSRAGSGARRLPIRNGRGAFIRDQSHCSVRDRLRYAFPRAIAPGCKTPTSMFYRTA
jgi:hypothetical protein